jgi:hypothetical protein
MTESSSYNDKDDKVQMIRPWKQRTTNLYSVLDAEKKPVPDVDVELVYRSKLMGGTQKMLP